MVNQSKINDLRFWDKWTKSGACGPGYAYAFFNCNASKKAIDEEIPYIRDAVKTPGHLELTLIETAAPQTLAMSARQTYTPSELAEIQAYAEEMGMKYFMGARCSTLSNEQTADEVAGILNQAYQSPLYQEGEKFKGQILYKKNGDFVERA